MKTFTLDELRKYKVLKDVDIVALPSGRFTLECRKQVYLQRCETREEAQAVLNREAPLYGLTDCEVRETECSELVVNEHGHTDLKIIAIMFVPVGYLVSRLDREFSTRQEADALLEEAAKSVSEAIAHELTNRSTLPVVKVIDVQGGQIVVRKGPMFGYSYTFKDANGIEQGSANNLSLLEALMPLMQARGEEVCASPNSTSAR